MHSNSHRSDGRAHAPTVSVVIPSYNTAPFIGETLDSVFAQTFTDFEVIVINDGSPDTEELERVLAPFQDRIVYLNPAHQGLPGARNMAIRAARGEYIALLDSDDIWEPEYLDVQVGMLKADPSIDVLFPNARFFGNHVDAGRLWYELNPCSGDVTFESLVAQRCSVLIMVTARRDTLLRAGLFDESLRSAEDFDLWLRIAHMGGRIVYHHRILTRYRKRLGSLSSDPVWMYRHILAVLDKCGRTMALSMVERDALFAATTRFRARLRLHEGKRAFFRREFAEARAKFTEANSHLHSAKLGLTVHALALAPRLLLRIYRLRDRLLFRASTQF